MQRLAAPWGGTYDGVKLTNTCTLDNILSRLYIEYMENVQFQHELKALQGDAVCQELLTVFESVSSGSWGAARLKWMTDVVKRQIRVSTLCTNLCPYVYQYISFPSAWISNFESGAIDNLLALPLQN